jgi:hypothetical protein
MMNLPGILAPLRMLAIPAAAGRDLAVVSHPLDHAYTAVARVRFPGITLNDSARQHHLVSQWGLLLAALCTEGSPITRLQVLQRVVPESGIALRAWHDAHQVPGAPELALRVSGQLLAAAPAAACRRESYLAVTLDARRARSAVRGAGGGDTGAAAVLVRHLKTLSQALAGADLEVQDWLGTRDLAEVIRTAYDPGSARGLDARRALAELPPAGGTAGAAPGADPYHAGPVHAEALPGSYRHDGAVSVSYWVSEWPRAGAYCTVLGSLLGDGVGRKSFCMMIEPLGPRVAGRVVMRDRTARDVAVRMRQRTGQVVPAHEHAAMAMAAAQDAERAAGHGLVRFTAYATVTVTDPAMLEDACAALEADAAAARVDLRRMWLNQDTGFAVGALPLGLGLPRRRW